jgi:septal ring factor EnvC (AmiA/AmiB activator)
MSRAALAAMLFLTLAGAVPARADSDDPQARLRAALKTATMRIRELEDQNAQLTAKQAAAERDKIDFTQKAAAADKELGELRQQTAADKTALEQASAAQKQQGDSIAKWQASYNQAAEAARTRDGDAKRLDAVVGKLRPQMQSCEAKNAELYKIGEEILGLYDKKGFLDLVAGEPVTKLKRVELENTMQDYEDKMRDNEIEHQTR